MHAVLIAYQVLSLVLEDDTVARFSCARVWEGFPSRGRFNNHVWLWSTHTRIGPFIRLLLVRTPISDQSVMVAIHSVANLSYH